MEIFIYDNQSGAPIGRATMELAKQYFGNVNYSIWITVNSLHDLERLVSAINIDPLVKPQFFTDEHPRLMLCSSFVFFVNHIVYFVGNRPTECEVSALLSKNLLITLNKGSDKLFDSLLQPFKQDPNALKAGVHFLLYAITDQLFDYYDTLLADWSAELSLQEERILERAQDDVMEQLAILKRKIAALKRSINHQADYLHQLSTIEHEALTSVAQLYFNHSYHKATDIKNDLDQMNNLIINEYNLYMTVAAYKSNEIMQNLTIVATIFMPLSFIVGLYGMNFKHMPETDWQYGYFFCLGLMALIATSIIVYLKRKKWL